MVADAPPPNRYRADIPPDLVDVIMLTLQRDPTARPTSASELRDLLRWSRAQVPHLPDGPAGGWLVRKTDPSRGSVTPPSGASDGPGQKTQPSAPRTTRETIELPAQESARTGGSQEPPTPPR
jgi:hypothetical protein